ncbi:hypothetical protein Hanom_Chr08g00734501 [Helianthus anomalus]
MRRIPILKALTERRLVFRSHIKRFWKNASHDDQNKTINSVVKIDGEKKPIIITEAVIREVIEFPDEENSPTKLPEKMVEGCLLRMGYVDDLNSASYLKSKFTKPYKFLIHFVLISMSHQKRGFDTMRDYLMNMVVSHVLNKKYNFSHIVFHYMVEEIVSDRKTWLYPRFVQMILDHAYPDLIRDEKNDLLVLSHMDNDSIRANYQDPDPENHEHWRKEEERKEKSYEEELKILKNFISKRSEWFLKEEKKKSRKTTPTVKSGEESSSQPKKKQKKATSMSLIDEPDEDVPATNIEKEQEVAGAENIEMNAELFTTDTDFVENVVQTVTSDIQKEKEKVIDDIEGDDMDKDKTSSSGSSEDEVVDEFERQRRMEEEIENERILRKRKRQEVDDDVPYVPSPEHISGSQSTPRGRKKTAGQKKATPKIRISKRPQKIVQKKQPEVECQKPPTPPQSPIHQSPARHSTPPQQSSPLKFPTPPNQPLPIPQSTPPPQQSFISSQDIFGIPPLSQLQPGSSSRGLQTPQDNLLDVAENKRLAAENKKAADREKLLVNRVQELEKKNRRDAQNEYFKLKHKELNEAKRARDHEFYMLNKVVESMLGSSVEEKFEELQVEEVRAERQAEIERQMKDKGKGVEGSSVVPEMALVPSMVTENLEPISAVSGL